MLNTLDAVAVESLILFCRNQIAIAIVDMTNIVVSYMYHYEGFNLGNGQMYKAFFLFLNLHSRFNSIIQRITKYTAYIHGIHKSKQLTIRNYR